MDKCCSWRIPDECIARKNYITLVYNGTIQKIGKLIRDSYIWFSIDETTDICGRYVAT